MTKFRRWCGEIGAPLICRIMYPHDYKGPMRGSHTVQFDPERCIIVARGERVQFQGLGFSEEEAITDLLDIIKKLDHPVMHCTSLFDDQVHEVPFPEDLAL